MNVRLEPVTRTSAPTLSLTLGPQPNTPRPHAEPPIARRTAILAFGFFLAGALHLAARGVSLGELQRAFPLYALGGFSILIFGTSRLLIAGMAGRDMVGGAWTAGLTVSPAALGAAGLYAAAGLAPASVLTLLAALWGAGALAHAVVTLMTVRRPPTRPPVPDTPATAGPRAPIRVLEAASLLYAVASGVLVPLAYAGRASMAAALHVVLVGFIIVTILGVAARILPRFTHARLPPGLLFPLALLATLGPVLMAFGLTGRRALLPWGAAVEGLAFVVFGLAVAMSVVRSRQFRPAHVAYAAAPLAIGVGGLLALGFVTMGVHGDLLATHGLLNVFGFVGLLVIAASLDLYAPALEAGAAPARRHAHGAVAGILAGLLAAALGSGLHHDALARAGMLLYAGALLWQIAGVVASHRRADRVLARFGALRARSDRSR